MPFDRPAASATLDTVVRERSCSEIDVMAASISSWRRAARAGASAEDLAVAAPGSVIGAFLSLATESPEITR